MIAEVVDERGRPAPIGEYGARVLVTVFFSKTLPRIRYALSDSLQLSPKACSCGLSYALLSGIQGRSDDFLALKGRNGGIVKPQPLVLEGALGPREWLPPIRTVRVLEIPRGAAGKAPLVRTLSRPQGWPAKRRLFCSLSWMSGIRSFGFQ